MPALTDYLRNWYANEAEVIADIDQKLADQGVVIDRNRVGFFYDYAFSNAKNYDDGDHGPDWIGAYDDWED